MNTTEMGSRAKRAAKLSKGRQMGKSIEQIRVFKLLDLYSD